MINSSSNAEQQEGQHYFQCALLVFGLGAKAAARAAAASARPIGTRAGATAAAAGGGAAAGGAGQRTATSLRGAANTAS